MRIAGMIVAVLLASLGCQHFDRARECRALADGVNPELRALAVNYTTHNPISAEELRAASNLYARAAARLDAVYFREPDIVALASQMKDNLKAIARSCDRLAARFEQADPMTDASARREIESQRQRHTALVDSIDRACQQQ
jgi:hypothetical protein